MFLVRGCNVSVRAVSSEAWTSNVVMASVRLRRTSIWHTSQSLSAWVSCRLSPEWRDASIALGAACVDISN